jgi:hypothetical protein
MRNWDFSSVRYYKWDKLGAAGPAVRGVDCWPKMAASRGVSERSGVGW